jgi:hypothetical protein
MNSGKKARDRKFFCRTIIVLHGNSAIRDPRFFTVFVHPTRLFFLSCRLLPPLRFS